MGLEIKFDSTERSVRVRVLDSTSGTPETGVAYNTDGIELWYQRDGSLKVPITPASLSALDDAHTDGGFLHISDGYCRLDVPDAAFAAGVDSVLIGGSATDMVFVGTEIQLIGYNPRTELTSAVLALLDAAVSSRAVPGDEMTLDADTIDAIGAAVNVDVTFTQTPAQMSAALEGERLTIQQASDNVIEFYVIGGIDPDREDSFFTVKTKGDKDSRADDDQSIIQISENDGLLYLNRAAAGDFTGTLVVLDESNDDGNGHVRITLSAASAAELEKYSDYECDYKELKSGDDRVRMEARLRVVSSVTQTISG